jgi:hypothetical protein
MTTCPACAGYTHAERHAIDRAGAAHATALAAIRAREAAGDRLHRFPPWERVDAAAWSPA